MRIYRADTFIDGSGADPLYDVEIHVADGVIHTVAPAGTVPHPWRRRYSPTRGPR